MAGPVLVLDTSTRRGAVGLAAHGGFAVAALDETRRHARDLAAACGHLLAAAGLTAKDLHAIYVGVGPGSYTGLRVGLMTAKALAYAAGCDLVAVPTFAALAHGTAGRVTVISDALQGSVYGQTYTDGTAADELRIVPVADLPAGPKIAPAAVPNVDATIVPVTAAAVFEAGRSIRPLSRPELFAVEPLYLRGSSAEEKLKAGA